MASSLNEESVEKKLKTVNNTQDSIQSLSLWIIHHKSHHGKIVELWMKVMKKTVQPSHRLTLFYLCNDVVQTCKKKKAFIYNSTFKEHLKEAAALVRDVSVKNKVERIFKIWEERGVYDAHFVKSLTSVLNGVMVKSKEHKKKDGKRAKYPLALPKFKKDGKAAKSLYEDDNNAPVSPPGTPYTPYSDTKEKPSEPQIQERTTMERDAEESARILAEFKPHEMIDQITAFQRQKAEIQVKISQLSHIKLDASNLDSIRHLKDRAHGNDYSNHFEDSSHKLDELVNRQTQHLIDQRALLDILHTSETFYEEQYREAKIVANAYKNFGTRINNMKKRLDELKKSFPEPDSPIPSPDINAPSPGNTPPHADAFDYNPARPGFSEDSWMYNGSSQGADSKSMNEDDPYQDSPPLEAPSPEGSPPDLNLGGSETTSGSLESRLASFMDRNNEPSTPPVYTPMPTSSSSKSYKPDDDGSTTPLDDETPTTPVQDEHAASPPKRSPPPKKENPIDFLSRLISQTQKTPTTKSAPSFLDTLCFLTNVGKPTPQPQPSLDRETSRGDADKTSQPWSSWKSSPNETSTSPTQPSPSRAYPPQPASPNQFPPTPAASTSQFPPPQSTSPSRFPPPQPPSPTQFQPPRTPTMVPPPMPMPVPPPIGGLSMSISIPPPPPPPLTLTSGIRPDFSSPPPGFQRTSPGQKENWPESGMGQDSDLSGGGGGIRSAHSSVLKELVPADSFEPKPADRNSPLPKTTASSLMDQDAMDIVSEEEDPDDDDEDLEKMGESGSEGIGEAQAEFAQKLKQKTSSQTSLKSSVFVPNLERPNLMTLTNAGEDNDVIDKCNDSDDTPAWATKSRKSSYKSRSRSRSRSKSRDKDKRHKKKKKHKRDYSDEEDESDIKYEPKNLESVVTKVDPRSSRDKVDKDMRYDDKFDKYREDRYDERRYDPFEDRDYRKPYTGVRNDHVNMRTEHSNIRIDHPNIRIDHPMVRNEPAMVRNNQMNAGFKDPTVEAYTQAYRDAMFQQLNAGRFGGPPPIMPVPPPPPMDPRRMNFRKF